jgi:succinate dehydrogenase/fumarate reductase-like Fe-S protein
MLQKLHVRAFFFNAKTDYLPYYKNFEMKLDPDAKATEILKEIKRANENFAYPEEKLAFRINGLVVTGEEKISEITERCGTELQVDPVSSYRSNHCLVINDEDFAKNFELLAPYATEEDKAYYESLYALHYASESSSFNHAYAGDALLLLAYRMIENGSEYKEEILRAIDDQDILWACEYENNLFTPQEHNKTITALKAMYENQPEDNLCNKVMQKCMQKRVQPSNVENLEGAQLAYYRGENGDAPAADDIFAQAVKAGASVIRFEREEKCAGVSLLETNTSLSYKKAATTLLSALDNGATVLVCADDKALQLFTEHFGMLQKEIGREIPLALLDLDTFNTMAEKEAVA